MSIAILFVAVIIACTATQQKQGIKGQVFWIAGNQLPGPDATKSAHYGVQRELYIYELTHLSQVTAKDGFFFDIQTKLISQITTKADGSFLLRLPPGKYSLFVKEEAGLYANLFDENNAINPVTVKERQYAWMPITVDYEAAY